MNNQPQATSCLVCGTVLDGSIGAVMQVFGVRRSSQNPNLCNRCSAHLGEGRLVELTTLFADLVGFTEMTHELGPEKSYEIVNGFFQKANKILVKHDAFIDKYIGDAVMAIFNVPIQSADHASKALAAAIDLQNSMPQLREQFGRNIQARVGVATGFARVGQIGSHDRKDYTAIGDVVNLASRLEAVAGPGEIVMDHTTYDQVAEKIPNLPAEFLQVKGFKDPVRAHRIQTGATLSRQAQQLDPVANVNTRQTVSVGSVLFAILGAPCAAAAILGPLSAVLGLGALLGAAAPFMKTLDQAVIRLPLQTLAIAGALINLYVIWHGYRKRRAANNQALALTRYERSKVIFIGALSALTLAAVGFEMYAHVVLQNMPLL